MAPNVADANGVLFESDAATPDLALATTPVQKADNNPKQLVWRNIILFAYLHLAALYGGYLFLVSAKWQTDIFGKKFLNKPQLKVSISSSFIDRGVKTFLVQRF